MSVENDGGPAYPIPDGPVDNSSGNWLSQYKPTSDGIEVRDVLACHALQDLLAGGCRMSEAGKSCWIAADEALAARTEPSAIDVLRKQHELMLAALKLVEPHLNEAFIAFGMLCLDDAKVKQLDDACSRIRAVLAKLK